MLYQSCQVELEQCTDLNTLAETVYLLLLPILGGADVSPVLLSHAMQFTVELEMGIGTQQG